MSNAPQSLAQEEEVIEGTSDTDELKEAHDEYTKAWKEATQEVQKSLKLEDNLRYQDRKVDETKENIEELKGEKEEVGKRIDEARGRVEELRGELEEMYEESDHRAQTLEEERGNLVSFVRYVALRDIVRTETGPVAGGITVRNILHGSLGEIVEEDLYHQALTHARIDLFERLVSLESESRAAVRELQRSAVELSIELLVLADLSDELEGDLHDSLSEYDKYLYSRDLTEAQLASIRETVAEVNARVFDAQRNVASINSRLHEYREKKYAGQLEEQQTKLESLETQQEQLEKRRDELLTIKKEAQDAHDVMLSVRNVDHRQYRRVEDLESMIKYAKTRIEEINKIFAEPLGEDATNEDHTIRRDLAKERDDLERKIPYDEEKLLYLRQGYLEDSVDGYLTKRAKGRRADEELATVVVDLERVTQESEAVRIVVADIEAKKENGLFSAATDPLASTFSWPVYGRITAGYFDAAYERHFGIPHRGIDIAIPHGSPVYSIADGIVQAIKDGGAKGYTYVLIGHRDGYTSLYGHLLKVYVSVGDIVDHGQVIGLSGGTPGTPGSGLMTTGPHVHLEIHQNGKYLNPFQVLMSQPN